MIYLLVGLAGFIYPGLYFNGLLPGIMHANAPDHVLHLVTGLVAAGVGFFVHDNYPARATTTPTLLDGQIVQVEAKRGSEFEENSAPSFKIQRGLSPRKEEGRIHFCHHLFSLSFRITYVDLFHKMSWISSLFYRQLHRDEEDHDGIRGD